MKPHISYVPLDRIRRAKQNPKGHDIPYIMSLIVKFGFTKPLVENAASGRLVAGHGRLESLEELFKADPKKVPARIRVDGRGRWLVPVLKGISFKSEREAEEYLIGDNQWTLLGGWNQESLVPVLRSLEKDKSDLLSVTKWTSEDIARMLSEIRKPTRQNGRTTKGPSGGVIRQIVLWFKAKEFEKVVARVARVAARENVKDHTAAFIRILEHYEAAVRR